MKKKELLDYLGSQHERQLQQLILSDKEKGIGNDESKMIYGKMNMLANIYFDIKKGTWKDGI